MYDTNPMEVIKTIAVLSTSKPTKTKPMSMMCQVKTHMGTVTRHIPATILNGLATRGVKVIR